MRITGKKILVTGGATGIGLGLAQQFIRDNNTVIICGRRTDVMEEVLALIPALITKQCDLESPVQREALYSWIAKEHCDLNVLVNNAGIQNWVNVSDDNFYSKAEQEIAINIAAPVHLASLFSQLGKLEIIMNVTSGLSFVPLVKVPVYSATKAFMHSFTLSLRSQLKSKNIEVIEIIPPALNTDLGGKSLHDGAPAVSGFIESIFQQMQEGKQELTYGFSENMAKAAPDELKKAFERMNGN